MKSFKNYVKSATSGFIHELHPAHSHEHNVQNMLFGINDYIPFAYHDKKLNEAVEDHPTNDKRLIFRADNSLGTTGQDDSRHSKNNQAARGLVVPAHMWLGGRDTPAGMTKTGKPKAARKGTMGMRDRNTLRGNVYGHEHRDPLGKAEIHAIHLQTLNSHFAKPIHEQIAAERAAIDRLHAAGHLDSKDTTDAGEKTDTVQNEFDKKGRSFVARSSKGVAGHALYTSGSGENMRHHVIVTCSSQSKGCGGGVDAQKVADTMKGDCFAPRAESQYVNAAVRRACHEQAKHDPAMTQDWILAHTHSLRKHAEAADVGGRYNPKGGKGGQGSIAMPRGGNATPKRFLFRPNVVDETDSTSRHVVAHLNKQRAAAGKPPIVGNSYAKTDELHDPENDWHVTFSNTGPKVKRQIKPTGSNQPDTYGHVTENIGRDNRRIRSTVTGTTASGKSLTTNAQGNVTPTKGSYLVTNIKRGGAMDKAFQGAVTHAKYWSAGRVVRDDGQLGEIDRHEITQMQHHGDEAHFDGEGNKLPNGEEYKSHYGYKVIKRPVMVPHLDAAGNHIHLDDDGKEVPKEQGGKPQFTQAKDGAGNPRFTKVRYDYQRQHVLHPRLVPVKVGKDTHHIPTDSRFKDGEFLPPENQRYKAPNGRIAGHLMVTTPTTSTPDASHHSNFTHEVHQEHIDHARDNHGEWEIDKPEHQEAALGHGVAAHAQEFKPVEHKEEERNPRPEQSGNEKVALDIHKIVHGMSELPMSLSTSKGPAKKPVFTTSSKKQPA